MAETKQGALLVQKLISSGWSKYKIAKQLGVSWQTVNNWHKDLFQPSLTYAVKLEQMTRENLNERQ